MTWLLLGAAALVVITTLTDNCMGAEDDIKYLTVQNKSMAHPIDHLIRSFQVPHLVSAFT